MNDKFDELAKGMAQSVTRRGALKKFGVGLAGMALACFGLADRAEAKMNTPECWDCINTCMSNGFRKPYCMRYCRSKGVC